MSSLARKLADLIDSSGDVKSDRLDNTISLGDNVKATFGASDDLQIYHDGSNSYIKDSGTGQLRLLAGTNFQVYDATGTTLGLNVNPIGELQALYNGSIKLKTTSTGIDVTGSVTCDGLTVDSATGSIIQTNAAVGSLEIKAGQESTTTGESKLVLRALNAASGTVYSRAEVASVSAAGGDVDLFLRTTTDSSGPQNRLKIDAEGDISFYEDTGTTPKFFWDASAESLGIGTTSPSQELHIYGSNEVNLQVEASTSGAGTNTALRLKTASDGSWNVQTGNAVSGGLRFYDVTNTAERMRINSNGNVGIGTSSPSAKLDVAGEVQCDSLDVDGNGDVTGTFTFHGSNSYTKTIGGANSDKWSSSFSVGGNHSTYYPVVFNIDNNGMDNLINISRSFGATAPYEWNNSNTHKGGLALTVAVSGGAWGGMPQTHSIFRMETSYTTIVAKTAMVNHGMNWCVWLRGGNAQYWVQSDKPINYTVYLSDTNLQNATHPAWVYTTTSVTISNKDYSV